MLSFIHDGNVGDIIASLPSIKCLLDKHGEKQATLYLRTGVFAHYTGNHPLVNVMLNEDYVQQLIPLLRLQPYIAHVSTHRGEKIDYNLNVFRHTGFDLAKGNLALYYTHCFPICPNLWEPWLVVDVPERLNFILINRTERYHNANISYTFLNQYPTKFIGLESEFRLFRSENRLANIERIHTPNFLETARAIAGCKLFIGNQSSCFQIAEALKVPRIIEICPWCPNVMPCGPNGYEAFKQDVFVKIVEEQCGNIRTNFPERATISSTI